MVRPGIPATCWAFDLPFLKLSDWVKGTNNTSSDVMPACRIEENGRRREMEACQGTMFEKRIADRLSWGMSASHRVFAPLLLLLLVALLVCGACATIRPTLSGQIINSERDTPMEPVEGVIVSVQRVSANPARLGSPQPGDNLQVWPAVDACTLSGSDGRFTLDGQHMGLIMLPYQLYRVRFHRDDYRDAVYDFFYEDKRSFTFNFLDQRPLGSIRLRPNWADGPATRSSSQSVDVISK